MNSNQLLDLNKPSPLHLPLVTALSTLVTCPRLWAMMVTIDVV
jgi:hypothetical protein